MDHPTGPRDVQIALVDESDNFDLMRRCTSGCFNAAYDHQPEHQQSTKIVVDGDTLAVHLFAWQTRDLCSEPTAVAAAYQTHCSQHPIEGFAAEHAPDAIVFPAYFRPGADPSAALQERVAAIRSLFDDPLGDPNPPAACRPLFLLAVIDTQIDVERAMLIEASRALAHDFLHVQYLWCSVVSGANVEVAMETIARCACARRGALMEERDEELANKKGCVVA